MNILLGLLNNAALLLVAMALLDFHDRCYSARISVIARDHWCTCRCGGLRADADALAAVAGG